MWAAGEAQRESGPDDGEGVALAFDAPRPSSPAGSDRVAVGELVAGTFLERLTVAERESLLAIGRRRRFQRGDVLMYQGEPDDRVMALLPRRVKVTRLGSEAREVMLSIRDPGALQVSSPSWTASRAWPPSPPSSRWRLS